MTQLALITGASGGIGQAVVMQLAQQDIHCVLVSRDAEKLHKLHSTLTKSHILEADVTDAQSTQQLWQQCVAAYGVPTLLVHCVGNTHIGALHKTVPQVLLKST